ncbi:hypothetical protein G3I60_20140 [Streptomyces sp. SID13666]|uniref:hypothetical protein n=1 Tax=Streptomyces sp. SID13666 TaxID=2706054 RepID=UPI0013BF8251|nr:hypothetical protein [Streptomyces sp. SID13666]NEA56392.1 hypothetical protein [Streptomyces sp. SID13666]
MAESIGSTLTARREFYRNKASESSSVTSIEGGQVPPKVIDDLIDNKMYRRKFNALIRKGHLQDLLDLAEVAQGKDKPSHWFARATRTTPVPGNESKPTFWDRSLKFLAKLRKVRRIAKEIGQRLKVPASSVNAVYKAVWRHNEGAIRMAVTAAETGKKHPFGLFCTLALKKPDTQAI